MVCATITETISADVTETDIGFRNGYTQVLDTLQTPPVIDTII